MTRPTPTQSLYAQAMHEEAHRQSEQGTFEAWRESLRLDPALFAQDVVRAALTASVAEVGGA